MASSESAPETYSIVSPIDGQPFHEFAYLQPEAAMARVEGARAAQQMWRHSSLRDRIDLCQRMLACYTRNLDENSVAITRMMGKPLTQARAEFEGGTCQRTHALCAMAHQALAPLDLGFDPRQPDIERWQTREPLGVVLDIAAWNYPLVVAINVIIPAVLSGNAVLIKHAPQTALVAEQFERAFAAAGAPPGLVTAFMVDHAGVADVLATRRIDHVAFTGSRQGGTRVYAHTARVSLASVQLELGGKDPALVLEDCDFNDTVEQLVGGVLYNAGQSCCAVERIYVQRSIFSAFVEAFCARSMQFRLGDPLNPNTSLGPLVNRSAAARIDERTEQALSMGARLCTPIDQAGESRPGGCYRGPRVFIDVNRRMDLMTHENFGPIIGIMPIDDIDTGLGLMNDSAYGLTASIWTRDLDRGRRMMAQVDAGTVYLNRCDAVDPQLAWVGVRDSGLGSTLGHGGFHHLTRPKSHQIRRR